MATPTTLPATFVSGNVLEASQVNALRGAFRVLQLVTTEFSTSTATTSTSYVTTNLAATLTPSSTSSKIAIFASLPLQCAASQNTHVTLFRGTVAGTNLAGANGFALVSCGANVLNESVVINYLDSPNTISAQTYTVGFKVSGGTSTAFLSTTTGSITIMEISA